MQLNAFRKYILSLPIEQAIDHVLECLYLGETGNEAWVLLHEVNGTNWHMPLQGPRHLVAETIETLRLYTMEDVKQ